MSSIVPEDQVFQLNTGQGIKDIPSAGGNRHPTSVFLENTHRDPEEQIKQQKSNQVPGIGNERHSDADIGNHILNRVDLADRIVNQPIQYGKQSQGNQDGWDSFFQKAFPIAFLVYDVLFLKPISRKKKEQ